jgi:hypothetical protein
MKFFLPKKSEIHNLNFGLIEGALPVGEEISLVKIIKLTDSTYFSCSLFANRE